ncbi:MAG TPA: hypothetical protein VIJ82_11635 [Streptosporangiaceae bacterium]
MRFLSPRVRWRWVVVVCGVAVLCAIPGIVAALPVPGSPITAAALRARILASGRLPYEGYVESTANFGLPSLPDLSDVSKLLDGTTEQYAWYRSPAHWRADTLGTAAENDVYQVCHHTYLWYQAGNLLTRVAGSQPVRLPRAADLLPPALAVRLLRLAAPADHLSRLPSLRIAGVDAAGLRLVPVSPITTVGAIEVWADPATGLPVAVKIYPRGASQPVLASSFLQFSYHRPALTTVIPHPAPGVDQATARLSSLNGILDGGGHPWPPELGGLRLTATPAALDGVAFYGSGFARLALLPLPERTGPQLVRAATSAGAGAVTLPGGTGVLVQTPLLTVLLASSQRFGGLTFLFAGPVTAAALEHAAGDLLTLIARAP